MAILCTWTLVHDTEELSNILTYFQWLAVETSSKQALGYGALKQPATDRILALSACSRFLDYVIIKMVISLSNTGKITEFNNQKICQN